MCQSQTLLHVFLILLRWYLSSTDGGLLRVLSKIFTYASSLLSSSSPSPSSSSRLCFIQSTQILLWGLPVLLFLALTSLSPVHHRFWELFYIPHKLLIPALIALFFLHSPRFQLFARLPLTLYLADLCMRAFSLLTRKARIARIEVYNDLVVLDVSLRNRFLPRRPIGRLIGAVVYLCVPALSRVQFHPLSVAYSLQNHLLFYIGVVGGSGSWTRRLARLAHGSAGQRAQNLADLLELAPDDAKTRQSGRAAQRAASRGSIRAQSQARAADLWEGSVVTRDNLSGAEWEVLLQGPFCMEHNRVVADQGIPMAFSTLNLLQEANPVSGASYADRVAKTYGQNVLFVSGGVGFAAVSSYILDLLHALERTEEPDRRVQITVVCVVAGVEHLQAMRVVLARCQQSPLCSLFLFCTFRRHPELRAQLAEEPDALELPPQRAKQTGSESEDLEADSLSLLKRVPLRFSAGRPNLRNILQGISYQPLKVFFSGPESLKQDLRAVLFEQNRDFSFHSESFDIWRVCAQTGHSSSQQKQGSERNAVNQGV